MCLSRDVSERGVSFRLPFSLTFLSMSGWDTTYSPPLFRGFTMLHPRLSARRRESRRFPPVVMSFLIVGSYARRAHWSTSPLDFRRRGAYNCMEAFRMFGKREMDKLRAWMGYLKDGGLDRPAASIPFDLLSTDGATDGMIEFLASMLTLATISGPAVAEEAMDGFLRDPEGFASDIDSEIEGRMAAIPLSDAMESMRSTEETLVAVTTLLHLFGLWQDGRAEMLHPAHTLRKLVLEPDSSRWVATDEGYDGEPPVVFLSKAEDMAASELLKFGVGVLVPLSDDMPFDLMLHWRGRMLRARIRTASRRDALTRFSLPAAAECDVMVLCDDESVYLLKPKEFGGRRGFTVRHRPTKSGRVKGCNFHEDFVVSAKRVKDVLDARRGA